jgi:hypothetical protein
VDETVLANCQLVLQNRSNFDMPDAGNLPVRFDVYYAPEIIFLSIDNRTNQNNIVDTNFVLIQSGAAIVIYFAPITGLQPKSMTGQLHFKINYGKQKDALRHSYEVRGEPQIGVNLAPNGEPIYVGALFLFKDIKYT